MKTHDNKQDLHENKKHRIFKDGNSYKSKKRQKSMENQVSISLENYEKDFLDFQRNISELRKTNPNEFIAFSNGKILMSGESMERIRDELEERGINPSLTVIEFVSKDEIRMIV